MPEGNALSDEAKLIMLPGMAADERLFEPQRQAISGLIVPPWIEPDPDEHLVSYAQRMASQIDPAGLVLIGGVSFGGMIALEMAYRLGLSECVLISSIRSPEEMPWRLAPCVRSPGSDQCGWVRRPDGSRDGWLPRCHGPQLAAWGDWPRRSQPSCAGHAGPCSVGNPRRTRCECECIRFMARPIELFRFDILIPVRSLQAAATC